MKRAKFPNFSHLWCNLITSCINTKVPILKFWLSKNVQKPRNSVTIQFWTKNEKNGFSKCLFFFFFLNFFSFKNLNAWIWHRILYKISHKIDFYVSLIVCTYLISFSHSLRLSWTPSRLSIKVDVSECTVLTINL